MLARLGRVRLAVIRLVANNFYDNILVNLIHGLVMIIKTWKLSHFYEANMSVHSQDNFVF